MAEVSLRPITQKNFAECISLKVADDQIALVASNVKSLAEAYVNPTLHPLGIYDASAHYENSPVLIGFAMYELVDAVGFVMRLMIDKACQGQGYGRAAMIEVIRRLRLHPEVEIIATSHLRENEAAARLYEGLGFVDWETEWTSEIPHERYMILKEQAGTSS